MMSFEQAGPLGESTPSSLQQCGGNQKASDENTNPQLQVEVFKIDSEPIKKDSQDTYHQGQQYNTSNLIANR